MARAHDGDETGAREDLEAAPEVLLEHHSPDHFQVTEVRAALQRLDAD